MRPFPKLPFRIGTTSYIIPNDILPNVHYLSGKVNDIELVLFELDNGPDNLPDSVALNTLIKQAKMHDLTYTVHLPLDLQLGDDGNEQHVSLIKARRVIECTLPLNPWAYVLHLDGKKVKDGATVMELNRWQNNAIRALEIVSNWVQDPRLLAVENLEGYPLDFLEPVLKRTSISRCVDIGHLWLDGHDPVLYLKKTFPSVKVIHIHGVNNRDHQSLKYTPRNQLDSVLHYLKQTDYRGVLTIEVFSEDDFLTSLAALERSIKQVWIEE
jgi:sugar phosphate isomerase/epimerase